MTRLFIEDTWDLGKEYSLDKENSFYLASVLRMRVGEQLIVVDSSAMEITGELTVVDKNACMVKVTDKKECISESANKITLYQSVSKGERMDLTIQKSVELGVSRIVPVFSSRCVVKPDKKSKNDRWQKIALEAARQCGRGIVPIVEEPITYKQALQNIKNEGYDIALFPWEEEHGQTLKQAINGKQLKKTAVFIGPEGGFSEDEAAAAGENGAIPVTLGRRILRTETAGPAVLAMLLFATEL